MADFATIEVDGVEVYRGERMPKIPAGGRRVIVRQYGRLFAARVGGRRYHLLDYSDPGDRGYLRTAVSGEVAARAAEAGEAVHWIGGGVTPRVPELSLESLARLQASGSLFWRQPSPTGIGSRVQVIEENDE